MLKEIIHGIRDIYHRVYDKSDHVNMISRQFLHLASAVFNARKVVFTFINYVSICFSILYLFCCSCNSILKP